MKYIMFLGLIMVSSVCAASAADAYHFDTKAQEKLFLKLSDELRCLVCQNQNIADSNAGLAMDLRDEIHTMIMSGKSEEQIVEFMVNRYGDYVLYNPPLKPLTWALWVGPVIIFFIGVIIVVRIVKRLNTDRQSVELSTDEKNRLNNLQSGSSSNIKDVTKEGKQR